MTYAERGTPSRAAPRQQLALLVGRGGVEEVDAGSSAARTSAAPPRAGPAGLAEDVGAARPEPQQRRAEAGSPERPRVHHWWSCPSRVAGGSGATVHFGPAREPPSHDTERPDGSRDLPGDRPRPRRRLAIDPIRFEVIRNALVEIAEEMAASLRRSAYSTNIKTRADFSCAFFDAQAAGDRPVVRPAEPPRLAGPAGARRRSPTTARSAWGRVTRSWSTTRTSAAGTSTTSRSSRRSCTTARSSATSPASPTTSTSAAARRPASARSRRSSRRGSSSRRSSWSRTARSSPTSTAWSSSRSGRSARPPATCGPRSRATTPASGG